MRRDAALAPPHDRVQPVVAAARVTARTGIALIAGTGDVVEVGAARPLQKIAADRGGVAKLRGRSGQQRLGDSLIGAAPTEVSAHAFTYALGIAAGLSLVDQTDRTHDLPGRAEAALQAVVGEKGLLHRMQPITPRHTLDRQDVGAVVT